MRRVVFNQKGGVGKSSITCNLAAISAARGKRTLVVDLDPQGNSTHYLLGKPASELEDTVADMLEQTVAFKCSTGVQMSLFMLRRFETSLCCLPALSWIFSSANWKQSIKFTNCGKPSRSWANHLRRSTLIRHRPLIFTPARHL